MNKIPLAQRLGDTNTDDFMMQLAGVHLEDFFQALGCQSNSPYFSKVYYNYIFKNFTTKNPPFAEAISAAVDYQDAERAELLYRLLIEPFV